MKSIWTTTTEESNYTSLPGSINNVEAAVIGGGMAGILISYFLKQNGIHSIVLEADRIGCGQTKNTTAKITSQHGLIYHKLIQSFSEEKAKQYADANQQAITDYKNIITEYKIDCEFEECPAFLYSAKSPKKLEEELSAAESLGISGSFTLDPGLPFPVKGAIQYDHQAKFHPLKFLKTIAEKLQIYEKTAVLSVDKNEIITTCGTVTANHIIFAAHYPFVNMPGYYFVRMYQERSYVIALKNAAKLNGMYLGIDEEDAWSLRNAGNLLLFGGCSHRTGKHPSESQYDKLRKEAISLWPDCHETSYWSAQDCMTLDGIPYIGTFSSSTPNWYVAAGFQKWGMTNSMVAAKMISDQIAGTKNPWDEVYSPQRFQPAASAKTLLENGSQAVRGLVKEWLSSASRKIDAIPPGTGGIIDYEGNKIGIYKDDNNQIFAISTRCPHLGCQLEWNFDEKSWDCPCHGSRFDYHGNLIDNPAQEDLDHV